jgi:hypothetical protein
MSEETPEYRLDRLRDVCHAVTVDANAYRDALKQILALTDYHYRGIVSDIEAIARRALEAAQ